MSFKINLKTRNGVRIQRLGENHWSAQSRTPYILITRPKIEFRVNDKKEVEIVKYDLIRPTIINSIPISVFVIVIEGIENKSITDPMITFPLGALMFFYIIMWINFSKAKWVVKSQL